MTINGAEAEVCVIESDESIRGGFPSLGVPAIDEPTLAHVALLNTANNYEELNIVNPTIVEGFVTPDTNVTQVSTDLSCSFNGGCLFQLDSTGLASKVKHENAEVNVCARLCTFREDLSSASSMFCELPAMETSSSSSLFDITQDEPIRGSSQDSNKSGMAT